MPGLDLRLLANATAVRLATVTNMAVYYGQVGRRVPGDTTTPFDPPTKSDEDLRVKPYAVLFPGFAVPTDEVDLGDTTVDGTFPVQVTVAAGDVEDLMGAVSRVHQLLYRWAPTVAGHVCGPFRPPPGFRLDRHLVDDEVKPARLYVPLQYQSTATT